MVSGITLGGAATGMATQQRTGIANRALKLEERVASENEARSLRSEASDALTKTVGIASQIIDAAIEDGQFTPQEIVQKLQPFQDEITAMAQASGRDATPILKALAMKIQTGKSAEQKAVAGAEAKFAGQERTIELILENNPNATRDQVMQALELLPMGKGAAPGKGVPMAPLEEMTIDIKDLSDYRSGSKMPDLTEGDVLEMKKQDEVARREKEVGFTKGRISEDKSFGNTTNQKWRGAGGYASALKNIDSVTAAVDVLREAVAKRAEPGYEETPGGFGEVSGPAVGILQEQLTEGLFTAGFPQAQTVMDRMAAVSQQNLKEVLGGQFAAREGEQLIKRAYNPGLSPEENLQRAEALLKSLVTSSRQKQLMSEHFQRNGGTLAGFNDAQFRNAKSDMRSLLDRWTEEDKDRDGGDKSAATKAATSKPSRRTMPTIKGVKRLTPGAQ